MAETFTPSYIPSFLGVANHYRSVEGFSTSIAPLTTLTNKKVKFEWSKKCKKIFQNFKDTLTSSLVLTLPRSDEGYVVYCDAS